MAPTRRTPSCPRSVRSHRPLPMIGSLAGHALPTTGSHKHSYTHQTRQQPVKAFYLVYIQKQHLRSRVGNMIVGLNLVLKKKHKLGS